MMITMVGDKEIKEKEDKLGTMDNGSGNCE